MCFLKPCAIKKKKKSVFKKAEVSVITLLTPQEFAVWQLNTNSPCLLLATTKIATTVPTWLYYSMSEIPYTPYWFCPIIKTIYQTIQVSSEVVFNDSNTEQMNDFTHFVLISTFYINIMLQKHLPPKNDWWKVIFFFLNLSPIAV